MLRVEELSRSEPRSAGAGSCACLNYDTELQSYSSTPVLAFLNASFFSCFFDSARSPPSTAAAGSSLPRFSFFPPFAAFPFGESVLAFGESYPASNGSAPTPQRKKREPTHQQTDPTSSPSSPSSHSAPPPSPPPPPPPPPPHYPLSPPTTCPPAHRTSYASPKAPLPQECRTGRLWRFQRR